jgi:hypothetical protein
MQQLYNEIAVPKIWFVQSRAYFEDENPNSMVCRATTLEGKFKENITEQCNTVQRSCCADKENKLGDSRSSART